MTPLLSVRGLTKSYGAHVGCVDVSFDLCPGEVMGIVGESGLTDQVLDDPQHAYSQLLVSSVLQV